MIDGDLQILRHCGLFEGLAREHLEPILERATARAIDRKEILFRQGDAVSGLFIVVSGRVKLSQLSPDGDEVILRLLGPRADSAR